MDEVHSCLDQSISVLTLAEIEIGVLRKAEGKRRDDLQHWFSGPLQNRFRDRILPFDKDVASVWAHIVANSLSTGRPLPTVDSQIAATALHFNLILVTRNVRDFSGLGIQVFNPWNDI